MHTHYTKDDIHKLAVLAAGKSPCKKRKVGAILTYQVKENEYVALSEGHNHNPTGGACELNGATLPEVVHAEIDCLNNYVSNITQHVLADLKMFITHEPCKNCAKKLAEYNLPYEVVGDFLKFDSKKLRYDLIPPEFLKEIAKVYTYGANKYKEGNWQKVDDPHKAYVGAAMRHLEAFRQGEMNDPESTLMHLAHAATNLSFLISLKTKPKKVK